VATVSLRDVTADNVDDVCAVKLGPGQEQFVAPTAKTLAQAAYYEEPNLIKAIYADEQVVGLAALANDEDGWYLWRLSVDHEHQGNGYGAESLRLIYELIREMGESEMRTSYVPGAGSPGDFYLRNGWEDTGQVFEGEHVLRIRL
jgi:diamine N-acetyltransferase